MALFDQAAFSRALDELNEETQRSEIGPTKKQSLGRIAIMGLIFNRMIGTGIFVGPGILIRATHSVGVTLVLWVVGGILALCGLHIWLEFGLSTPRHTVSGERLSVPRSGGEKNYLEYVYSRPERLATSMFGIPFIILGNRAGNALAFGIYVMEAAGYDNASKGSVIGIAIAGLTFAAALHMFTRAGGIWMNNIFGFFKAGLLLALIIVGAIAASGRDLGNGSISGVGNYNRPFSTTTKDAIGIANAFTYVFYAYAGFEQPFYVLSEFNRPRKWFPRYITLVLVIVMALFVGLNVVYFYVVPVQEILEKSKFDVATLFLSHIFGNDDSAKRAISSLISVSILGNLIVTTFTMSRVKQEIAKEGILPWSLFWATSHTTPAAKIGSWFRRNVRHKPAKANLQEDYDHQEQTPMAALMLNLLSALVLIALTSFLEPYAAYQLLVNIYTYSLVFIVGAFVSGGMLLLKLVPKRKWATKTFFRNTPKIIGLMPATFYFLVCLFLLVAGLIPPFLKTLYPYYVVPIIGLSSPFWGVLWWLGLHLRMRITNTRLMVSRVPYVVPDPDNQGEYIQKAELIDHEWHSALRQRRPVSRDDKGPMIHINHVEPEYQSRNNVDRVDQGYQSSRSNVDYAERGHHSRSNLDYAERGNHSRSPMDYIERGNYSRSPMEHEDTGYYPHPHLDRNDPEYQPRYNPAVSSNVERSVSRSPNFDQRLPASTNYEPYPEQHHQNYRYENGGMDMYDRDRR